MTTITKESSLAQLCKRGHDTSITGRYSNNPCRECHAGAHKLYRKKNSEKKISFDKKFYAAHPLYKTWDGMKTRCLNTNPRYKHWNGRGIKVCDRWMRFESFEEDITKLLGLRPKGMTLDRKDNDGNYEPNNVRWATFKEQRANQRLRKPSKIINPYNDDIVGIS